MVTGFHLPKILILKLWLPGGQEMLKERHFSVKCTRWAGKKSENENMMNSLNKEEI